MRVATPRLARISTFALFTVIAFGTVATAVLRPLTDVRVDRFSYTQAALADDGGMAVATSTTDPVGTNPLHAHVITKWSLPSGGAAQLSSAIEGAFNVSVSDDGQWLAFVSGADLVGTNHDEQPELFVMRSDGSQLAQLTSAPLHEGNVLSARIAGSANRIAFVSTADPLGTNPTHDYVLFIVDRSGANLRQLASSAFDFSISDDGARVVFSSYTDATGGNPDVSLEIFAINADGTGLRQLTSAVNTYYYDPEISGDGETVVYWNVDSTGRLHVIKWNGTGWLQLATGDNLSPPSIRDDGKYAFFEEDSSIFAIDTTGGAPVLVTAGSTPVVSGDGSRLLYTDTRQLKTRDVSGGPVQALTPSPQRGWHFAADISADGNRVAFVRQGTGLTSELYSVDADGSSLTQLTSFGSNWLFFPSITADGGTIVFSASAIQGSGVMQVYRVGSNGSGLQQLSPATSANCDHSVVAAIGNWVVFKSDGDLTGGNPGHFEELFRVALDGSGLAQITFDQTAPLLDRKPQISATGEWVVFQSDSNLAGGNADGSAEIFRVRIDGTGYERLTGDPVHWSIEPDVSGDGSRIVYGSWGDPLGTNPENNSEIFLYEPATGTRRQLTVMDDGESYSPRISPDGAYVYFKSSAEFFEEDERYPYDAYRVSVATGLVERVGGLAHGNATLGDAYYHYFFSDTPVPDADGSRAVFAGFGDWTDQNPDREPEVWLADWQQPSIIRPSKAAPTLVTWDAEPKPRRYDVIRGSVADLAPGPGSTVDLGSVACVEDDSPDTHTAGYEDVAQPVPGQAFFYLYRGTQGEFDGPGSYGQGTGARERVAGAGDCQP